MPHPHPPRQFRAGERRWRLLLLTCAFLPLCGSADGSAPPPEPAFRIVPGARIPLRDGLSLSATLYLPSVPAAPVPALFLLSPYTTDPYHREAAGLARRGFAFAAVDVRGRGGSQGRFEPWIHDGKDGADIVAWLARQPWSNGDVGMLGHSFSARAVWSTLKERPSRLRAAVPISASFPMQAWGNVVGPDILQWIVLTHGATLGSQLSADEPFWNGILQRLFREKRPLRQLDRLAGFDSPLLHRLLDHPTLDSFWTSVTPTPDDFARIDVPVLTIAGQYETHQRSSLWYYREHLRAAGAGASRHRLVLGPWDHPGTLRPSREFGGLTLGEASQIDVRALVGDWFDHTLRNGPRPAFLDAPVRLYELGSERWLSSESLEAATRATYELFLGAGAGARSLTGAGSLDETTLEGAPRTSWVYDPHDLRRAGDVPAAEWITAASPPDDLWGCGLAFETPASTTARVVRGSPRLVLFLAVDVPDSDIVARLEMVSADGRSTLLGDDFVRLRYRNSLERAETVPQNRPFELGWTLPFVSRMIPAGNRLRLILYSPNSPHEGKNWNGGGVVANESAADGRIARITVHHDRDHPSRLVLPLGE